MIKYFNQLMSLSEISECYRRQVFPNAYCLLWNQDEGVTLLNTENDNTMADEGERRIAVNGGKRVQLYKD